MTVPGARGHLYHLQLTLLRADKNRCAYFFKGFHQDVFHWRHWSRDILNQQTFLVKVVQNLPNALGFCDTLFLVNGGVWIDPDGCGSIFVWRLAWTGDIVEDLFICSNLWGNITNYYLELVVLVLQESCFRYVCSDHHFPVPET